MQNKIDKIVHLVDLIHIGGLQLDQVWMLVMTVELKIMPALTELQD